MRTRYAWYMAGLAAVLAVIVNDATAQERKPPVSDVRIPVRKDARVVQESRGEVALATEVARVNELESRIMTLQQRLDAAEVELARLAALPARVDANVESIRALEGTLRTTREELALARTDLAASNARVVALEAQIAQFDRRMRSFQNHSLFGNSGFYIGLGTGATFTTGTLHNIGYGTGLNVVMPIGWSKPGNLLGLRGELGVQTFEGRVMPGFQNIDPRMYTATAMLTLNVPLNTAKNNLLYLMGGGGVFMFDRYGALSTLEHRITNAGNRETKFGVTGGAGLEFHILGATSLFVESGFTNLFAEKPVTGADASRHLRWVPLAAGITLR